MREDNGGAEKMENLLDITLTNPLELICAALVMGLAAAAVSSKFLKQNNSVTLSLILLPPLVCAALLAINGSIGASIGVLGVFSLVRFRSVAGSAKDIVSVFYAMTVGLITATGHVFTAAAVTVLVGIVIIAASSVLLRKSEDEYMLKILCPEQLNIDDTFDEILKMYFKSYALERMKTTNMGAMFELNYKVVPKEKIEIKKMMDDVRCRNGNLTVAYYRYNKEIETL